jgi:iron complex outermembrane receptor protein
VNGLEWFGRVDVQHYGDKYWQVDNLDVQDPRTYLNLRLGLEGERWNAYVWGRNITDTKAYSDFYPREYSGLDVDIGYRVPRRAYGLQVRWTF